MQRLGPAHIGVSFMFFVLSVPGLPILDTRFLYFCVAYIQETFDTENGNTGHFPYAGSLLESRYHLKSHLASGSEALSPQFSGPARSTRTVAFLLSVVFNHDTVADHPEWFPWQLLGSILVKRSASLSVESTWAGAIMPLSRSFLTYSWRQSMCLSLVLCAEPSYRQKILAASLSISSVKGLGKAIPISSITHDSPMMSSAAFPTENISTAAELISA